MADKKNNSQKNIPRIYSVHGLDKSIGGEFRVTLAIYIDGDTSKIYEIFAFRTKDEKYFNSLNIGDRFEFSKVKK